MMRKAVAVCAVFFLAVSTYAQVNDLDDLDPALFDPTQVDLSDVNMFFHGPIELYVTGVRYAGVTYSAVLEYDGGTTVRVREPDAVPVDMLPNSIDLSRLRMSLTENGVRLDDVVVDGDRYGGIVLPTATPTELVVDRAWLAQRDVVPSAAQVAELERRLQTRIDDLRADISARDRTIEEREATIAEREAIIEEREEEIAHLRRRLEDVEEPRWRVALDTLTDIRLEGFADGSPALGTWDLARGRVSQTDAAQRFAKFEIPVEQDANEILYSLEGQAHGAGRVGYGLHFLASDVDRSDLWGYGRSYLVWLTRDPAAYQTDATFVQLYTSTSAVNMIMVASQKISPEIADRNLVQVYADRQNGEITVAVEDEHVFTFRDPDFFGSGTGVALRTLGRATFHGLQVTK